jgi:hypothetical protein
MRNRAISSIRTLQRKFGLVINFAYDRKMIGSDTTSGLV